MDAEPRATVRTLVDLVRFRADVQPDDTAYVFLKDGEREDARLTYASLCRQMDALGMWLDERGVDGRPVMLVYPAGLDFVVAFFATLAAGGIPVPAPAPRRRSLARIDAIAKDCGATLVLTTRRILQRVEPLMDDARLDGGVRWQATDGLSVPDRAATRCDRAVTEDDLALLQYTSGSTGTPKGVMVAHRHILENQRAMRTAFRTGRDTIVASWLPHYHDMGLIGNVLHPSYVGGQAVLMSPEAFARDPSRWLVAIATYGATTSGGPNFGYQLCVDRLRNSYTHWDLRTWRTAFVGAEPVRSDTLRSFVATFRRFGFRPEALSPCYGLAEATLLVTARANDHELKSPNDVREMTERASSRDRIGCGSAASDVTVRIVDTEHRTLCAEGQTGEIWVKGPSIALGYWNRPAETAKTFASILSTNDGPYLRTGDLGYFENGDLFVVGRLKNVVIVNGQKYHAEDIENAVHAAHEALAPSAIAVFAVERGGREHIVAAAELRRKCLNGLDLDAVLLLVREAAAEILGSSLDALVLLEPGSLPRTSSGKPDYVACREGFVRRTWREVSRWDGAAQPSVEAIAKSGTGSLSTEEDVQNWLLDQVAERTGLTRDVIDVAHSFAALGLQSVDVMTITELLADLVGRNLEPTLFWEYPSVAEVAAYVAATARTR